MRVLGIDPARGKTGLAVVDVVEGKPYLIHHEVVRSKPKETMKDSRERIVRRVWALIQEHRCEMAGMEAAKVGTKDDENPNTYFKLLLEIKRNIQSIHVQARIVGGIEWELERNDFLVVPFENAAHWRQRVGIRVGPDVTRDMLKADAIKRCVALFGRTLTDDEAEAALAGWAATMMAVEA